MIMTDLDFSVKQANSNTPLISSDSRPTGYQSAVHTMNANYCNTHYPVRIFHCIMLFLNVINSNCLGSSLSQCKIFWVLATTHTVMNHQIYQGQITTWDWQYLLFSAACAGQLSFVQLLLWFTVCRLVKLL